MENRVHKRHKTGSYCNVECAIAKDVKIKDISIDGICLETSQHIDTRNPYDMKLVTKNKEEIMLKGEVVWSSLIKSIKDKDNIYPIYDIGLKFIEQNDYKNKFLEKLIEQLTH
ncbi:MAG: PilZ domain-containing protein [Candidatus Hodarchaeales archaeon]|jgi:hypothetical protein